MKNGLSNTGTEHTALEKNSDGSYYHSETTMMFSAWCARAEQAQADTTRLNWLANSEQRIGDVQVPANVTEQNLRIMRAGIDCAMQQTQPQE